MGNAHARPLATLPPRDLMVRAVERSMATAGLQWKDRDVVVAVSGGADSTFLLHATHALRRKFCYRLVIAHVDHGWRGQASRDDALAVARAGASLRIPVHTTVVKGMETPYASGGAEAAARAVRYQFLADIARACQAVAVLVAHTADDQAETIVMSLIRGRSITGLGGMADITTLPVVNPPASALVRPLLSIRATAVRAALERHGIGWRVDASNDDLARTRNRIRHTVMPALEAVSPGFRTTLARSARSVTDARDVVDSAVRGALARWGVEPNGWSLSRTEWLSDASLVRLGALRAILVRVGVCLADIESGHLTAVDHMIASNRGGASRNVGHATVGLVRGRVVVSTPNLP